MTAVRENTQDQPGIADCSVVDVARDLIGLDEAAAAATDAGADAGALLAAARQGTLDTVQIDGLPYLRRAEVDVWLRFLVVDVGEVHVLELEVRVPELTTPAGDARGGAGIITGVACPGVDSDLSV